MEDNKNKQQEQENLQRLIEDPEAIQEQVSRSQQFIEKNKNVVMGALAVVLAAVGGYFFYQLNIENQDKKAQAELAPAVFFLEKDSLNKALDGDGNFTTGIVSVTEDYGSTPAANLSHFYAGTAYMKQGEFDKAIEHLKSFSSSDLLVQARAYALIGDAYVEKKDYDQAASYFQKAADYKPNKQFTPAYLLKLAFVEEERGNSSAAVKAYEKIINDYNKSQEVTDAKKYLAELSVVK